MSDPIKHECGIAFIRLLKPLEYYFAKYGTNLYALNKLSLLMEKQHNRGQDGAGIVCIKLDMEPGTRYINRLRSNSPSPIIDIFSQIYARLKNIKNKDAALLNDTNWLKQNSEFVGELLLGHLRYGTFGKNSIDSCHPFVRSNNKITKNLVLAGNFNLTNVDELFEKLINLGQHPIETSDTITILEKISHFLDEENEDLYQKFKNKGHTKREITGMIATHLDVANILKRASKYWDGGYVLAGLFGHGDAFIMRDPSGIRPAYWFANDEVVIAASERPVIQTTFNVNFEDVIELSPGHALIVKKDGRICLEMFRQPTEKKACSFERIYFSRGTDAEIYSERKKLGRFLAPSILKAIDYNLESTVFSYIPNTAASAFYGLHDALHDFCNDVKKDKILSLGKNMTPEALDEIMKLRPRVEKIAVKDLKIRTFITQDNERDDLVGHIYDTTYGIVNKDVDNIVVIDDSIVRGTTLKKSVIHMLDRLGPRQIIIASSAPQIRYPDCYGIDMAKLSDFVAFKAAIELLHEKGMTNVINQVYKKCKESEKLEKEQSINHVKEIYAPFTSEQISEKITEILTPKDISAVITIIYQSIEDLHDACPKNLGDWYFTGNYPTPGGNKVVNRSFINFIEGRNVRAY